MGDETQIIEVEENETTVISTTWFGKMEGALYWKVIPPDFLNPYRPRIPDTVLMDWVKNMESLKKVSSLRCMCDGYEVLMMRDLVDPIICSDHPCITMMSYSDILEYIELSGVSQKVVEDLEKAQNFIREELLSRERQAIESPERDRKIEPKKKKTKEKVIKKPNYGGGGYRVIRSGF